MNNIKLLAFMGLFFFINCLFLAITCFNKDIAVTSKRFILFISLILILNISMCCVIFYAKKKNWPIEKVFLLIASLLGTIYTFTIPMGRAPDEPAHIWRAYSISQGAILTETQEEITGNSLPENIANFGADYTKNAYSSLADRLSEQISDTQTFKKTISSNPIDYLPHIIGLLVGRLLHLPLIVTLYLARLCGLALCIAIIYFCLKYIPIAKKSLFFLSCLPLTMQTYVSISYDGVILCSAIAIITIVLYAIRHQSKVTFKPIHCVALSLLCFALTAVKPVYFPICLLLFFIPTKCFHNRKQKIISIVTIIFITISLFFIWSLMATVTEPGNGADTNGQISYIISNPIRYLAILIHNIINLPFVYLQRFGSLEWLDVHINDFYIITTLIVFVILCIEEHIKPSRMNLTTTFKFTTFFVLITSTILIYSALYIQWTSVGAPIIEGVQTRYLLPTAILIPLLCLSHNSYHRKSNSQELIPQSYLYSFIIFLSLNAITILFYSHL